MPKISVIIPTYNRTNYISEAIESILSQTYTDFEIVVVDNNSTDNTKEVIENYIQKYGTRLKYLFEPKQGKSYALNKGIKEAKGAIIVFTDDDVIVDQKWLKNIWECFSRYNCDAVGGKIVPLFPNKTPKWIKENRYLLNGPISAYEYGEETKIYEKTMPPFAGANMAIRKDCITNIGLFRTDLGPGKGAVGGEDTDYFRRLKKNNKNIYYCGKAFVWHKVARGSVNLCYIASWYIKFGRYEMIQEINEIPKGLVCYFGIPRYKIKTVLKDIPFLIYKAFNRKEFLKVWMRIFWNVGQILQYRISIGT